ncbi:LrgB family protein [Ureibacillus thermophilus]|uniref:LrgB family protein n=1 Tax=Ureibacillus thermophilus TaxID=367743 RepID=UPI0036081EA6
MWIVRASVSIISTVCVFLLMRKLYSKYPTPLLMPILTSTIIIIAGLLLLNIPFDVYMEGGRYLQHLLGPGVVALAYPLYNQWQMVLKYKYTILSGVLIAMVSGIISVYTLLVVFKIDKEYILTALPKSMTTPVAMNVSETIGGIPPLTAVLVLIAGFTGALLGPLMYSLGRIHSPISRGVAMGSASHGVGTAKLVDYGELDLSVGSLSMGLSAVVGAILCPIFVYIFM